MKTEAQPEETRPKSDITWLLESVADMFALRGATVIVLLLFLFVLCLFR
jgi:hypothetical protein